MFNLPRKNRKLKGNGDTLSNALAMMYQRMSFLLDSVPEGADLDIDKDSDFKVMAVIAIEQEWILDPILRAEMSLVNIEDK